MAQKVAKVGIKKEPGYLYFVDSRGDISRARMVRGGRKRKKKGGSKRKARRRRSSAKRRRPARKRRR